MVVDYLIIGQGLSGTFLSYYLIKAGKKVMVIDKSNPFTASKVASGVINPVTGRRIVRTWRIEELLPFALRAYSEVGTHVGQKLIKECSVLDFHPSLQMKESFEKRLTEEQEYLHKPNSSDWSACFNFNFGIGEISPCLLADINLLLKSWRKKLQSTNNLMDEEFRVDDCIVNDDFITYQNITAHKIIYCEGAQGVNNPFFKNLPYAPNKGEALIAKIQNLSPSHIYKQGISIVPWKEDLFWVGSSYDWNFADAHPTLAFRAKIIKQLKYWLKIPFEVVDHIASVRPANMERRPFVGIHPKFPVVAILNGMGTKGCSLAPFFAKQLTDFLTEQKAIYPDANVNRFEKMFSRKIN